MAKMRARRISGSRWVTRSGSRPSGIARASRSAMPSRRSAWASNMTPPSELIRPPSKAAVIFLRRTAGKQNGRRLSSVMAGVRASIPAKGWLQQPNPTPDQQLTLLPPPLIRPRHEYDRLVSARQPPARGSRAFPDPLRNALVRQLVERLIDRDAKPVAFMRAECAVADRQRHDVGDDDKFSRMFAQVVHDQPGKLAALEVAGPILDVARHDLIERRAGPQDADRRLDMRQIGAQIPHRLFGLDDQPGQFRPLIIQFVDGEGGHRCLCQYPAKSADGLFFIASVTTRSTWLPLGSRRWFSLHAASCANRSK